MRATIRSAVPILLLLMLGLASSPTRAVAGTADGLIQVRSAHGFAATVSRLKGSIEAKGIMLFAEIDQRSLAAKAGVATAPSTLLVFGNPRLGGAFVNASPTTGLDWPVRLLVYEDAAGAVWVAYSDFAWIARRHGIADGNAAFDTATGVVAGIVAAVQDD